MRHQSGPGRMTNLSLTRTSAGPAGSCMWQNLPAPSGTCAMLGVRLPPIMLQSKHLPLLYHTLCVRQCHLDNHVLSWNLHALQKCWPVFSTLHAAMCMRFSTSDCPAEICKCRRCELHHADVHYQHMCRAHK